MTEPSEQDRVQGADGAWTAEALQAEALEQLALRLDDLAAKVRTADADRAAQAIGDAARRHPLLVVAGAAVAGFAATRLLTAPSPVSQDDDPWGDDSAAVAACAASTPGANGGPR